jgi:histidine triad (HIT) family protein
MPSLFTRIVQGEIPCHKLAEDERFLAFLDVRPAARGHALVIPKAEHEAIFDDLPEDLLRDLLPFARPVARAIRAVVPCRKIGLAVVGIEVPHVHLHLIPVNTVGDLSFANARPGDPAELAALAEQIRAALAAGRS